MLKIPRSQSSRTTTGIQSGPDTLAESTADMAFLTILIVTETLCSFRLVLDEKADRKLSQ